MQSESLATSLNMQNLYCIDSSMYVCLCILCLTINIIKTDGSWTLASLVALSFALFLACRMNSLQVKNCLPQHQLPSIYSNSLLRRFKFSYKAIKVPISFTRQSKRSWARFTMVNPDSVNFYWSYMFCIVTFCSTSGEYWKKCMVEKISIFFMFYCLLSKDWIVV